MVNGEQPLVVDRVLLCRSCSNGYLATQGQCPWCYPVITTPDQLVGLGSDFVQIVFQPAA